MTMFIKLIMEYACNLKIIEINNRCIRAMTGTLVCDYIQHMFIKLMMGYACNLKIRKNSI